MASGDTRTNQYLDIAANGTRADLPTDTCCETRTQTLIRGVAERIMDVEDEVERLENNPDVVDIVATYADLQNYDTSTLTDKDIIRVLQDETHDGDSTYYRYNAQSGTWTYVGESKQYEDFVGTDGTAAGEAGLVPAPAVTDAGKFLNANGAWEVVQAGPTVVQTTGTSTTDVMSQNATTSMVFADPSDCTRVQIGKTASTQNTNGIAIGEQAKSIGTRAIVIGDKTNTADVAGTGSSAISIGVNTTCTSSSSGIAIGTRAQSTGEAAIAIGVYNQATGNNSTAIGGYQTKATGGQSIAIGAAGTAGSVKTEANALCSVAIGSRAQVANNAQGGVAIGYGASATRIGELNVGTSSSSYGYRNSEYRLLSGLHDGEGDHDAVTVGQLNTAIAGVTEAEEINSTDWSNLWQ